MAYQNSETTFAKLSQEAQDAIVWAVMSSDDELPPNLSQAAKDEIREWASDFSS